MGENTYLLLWQDRIVLYVGAFGVHGAEDHLEGLRGAVGEVSVKREGSRERGEAVF